MKTINSLGIQEIANVKFLSTINDFFTFSTPHQHLALLESWHDPASIALDYKKHTIPEDMLYRHRHFIELYEAAYACCIAEALPGNRSGAAPLQLAGIEKEQELFDFYPPDFSNDELIAPAMVIRQLFAQNKAGCYKEEWFEWLVDSFSGKLMPQTVMPVQLYHNTKKLVWACWLIRERATCSITGTQVMAQAKDIAPLVNFITTLIPVQYIFCLRHRNQQVDLMIILDQHCSKSFASMQPLLEFAALGHPSITCTLHNYGILNELLQQRMLYYINACTESNCVYRSNKEQHLPLLKEEDGQRLKKAVAPLFRSGMKRAADFYSGAHYYLQQQALTLVPFMLQQACELTYRALLRVMKGNEVKCHELCILRNHIKRFVPDMIGVFSKNETEECRLLELLGKAYINARYTIDYMIPREELLKLADKTGRLMERALQVFDNYPAPSMPEPETDVTARAADLYDEWF